ncbi:unnamed protein product, partial [Durusdinium trenchii]
CVPSTNRFALCGGYRACGIARLLLSIHPFFYRRGPIVHVLPKIRSVPRYPTGVAEADLGHLAQAVKIKQ